jgi:small subunit ribosomal protein S5
MEVNNQPKLNVAPEIKAACTSSTTNTDGRRSYSQSSGGFNRTGSSGAAQRRPFDPNKKRAFGPGQNKPASTGGPNSSNGGFNRGNRRTARDNRKQDDEMSNLDSAVIEVRRVTRVVRGGKRMRFSALVVVGDKAGRVGYGLKKGMDYQEAVAKATKKAKDSLIKINITDQSSLPFSVQFKYKSACLMLKPASTGTGLIAGGYLRPVLDLAGIKNIYSKLIGSRNKIVGVQAAIQALEKYKYV